MRDPDEGLDPQGTIRTGVRRERVPAAYEPLLAEASASTGTSALYVYGSVATGRALPGRSDVDLLAIGLDAGRAADLSAQLTGRYAGLARGVSVGVLPGMPADDGDEAYGNRVFLRHYCAWAAGPDPAAGLPVFAGDAQAARGFNGDLPGLLAGWRAACGSDADAARLAPRVGRKTLFAVAGLVSVHDRTWTTDRAFAAARWGEVHPALTGGLAMLLAWGEVDRAAEGGAAPEARQVLAALDGVVATVCHQFVESIGAWRA